MVSLGYIKRSHLKIKKKGRKGGKKEKERSS
jgi:hypothetical protein